MILGHISSKMHEEAMKSFLESWILTDTNLQVFLNAIIDSYIVYEKYVSGWIYNIDELDHIIPWVSDTTRLSNPEIALDIIKLMRYDLEEILEHGTNLQNMIGELKRIGVKFSEKKYRRYAHLTLQELCRWLLRWGWGWRWLYVTL